MCESSAPNVDIMVVYLVQKKEIVWAIAHVFTLSVRQGRRWLDRDQGVGTVMCFVGHSSTETELQHMINGCQCSMRSAGWACGGL